MESTNPKNTLRPGTGTRAMYVVISGSSRIFFGFLSYAMISCRPMVWKAASSSFLYVTRRESSELITSCCPSLLAFSLLDFSFSHSRRVFPPSFFFGFRSFMFVISPFSEVYSNHFPPSAAIALLAISTTLTSLAMLPPFAHRTTTSGLVPSSTVPGILVRNMRLRTFCSILLEERIDMVVKLNVDCRCSSSDGRR